MCSFQDLHPLAEAHPLVAAVVDLLAGGVLPVILLALALLLLLRILGGGGGGNVELLPLLVSLGLLEVGMTSLQPLVDLAGHLPVLVSYGQPQAGADGLGEGPVGDVPLLLLALAFLDDLCRDEMKTSKTDNIC